MAGLIIGPPVFHFKGTTVSAEWFDTDRTFYDEIESLVADGPFTHPRDLLQVGSTYAQHPMMCDVLCPVGSSITLGFNLPDVLNALGVPSDKFAARKLTASVATFCTTRCMWFPRVTVDCAFPRIGGDRASRYKRLIPVHLMPFLLLYVTDSADREELDRRMDELVVGIMLALRVAETNSPYIGRVYMQLVANFSRVRTAVLADVTAETIRTICELRDEVKELTGRVAALEQRQLQLQQQERAAGGGEAMDSDYEAGDYSMTASGSADGGGSDSDSDSDSDSEHSRHRKVLRTDAAGLVFKAFVKQRKASKRPRNS